MIHVVDSSVASQGVALLWGGVSGGIISGAIVGLTWFFDRRSALLRTFLDEGLKIHALREAWILEGPNAETTTLAERPDLAAGRIAMGSPWLVQVEVRSVLDQAVWNSPEANGAASYYAFLDGRRTWIVRNKVQPQRSFGGPDISPKQPSYPALLSSQAMLELCGWIERVASVNRRVFLGEHACRALFHLLACVSGEDRIAVFGARLTERAIKFLRWYHGKYANVR